MNFELWKGGVNLKFRMDSQAVFICPLSPPWLHLAKSSDIQNKPIRQQKRGSQNVSRMATQNGIKQASNHIVLTLK